MTDYQVFIDLDATTVAWSSAVAKHFSIKNLPTNLPNGLYPWFGDDKTDMRKSLNRLMETYNFWRDLEPYAWSKELVQMVAKYGDVYFLSKARPNAGCMAGKMEWIKFHFPHMEEKTILTTRDKWVCSGKNRILIDDDLRHKKMWEDKGGIFYHWEEIADHPDSLPIFRGKFIQLKGFLNNL
jgi:5'(3')-deoxyribonucleotidase